MVHSIYVFVEVPDQYSNCGDYWDYRDKVEHKTRQLGWPTPESCGPFGWPKVEAFSLCYDVDDSIDHIAHAIAELRAEFEIGDVTIDAR
jgi:hypothetical protein